MMKFGKECVEIRVRGQLDAHWSEWFDGLVLSHFGQSETMMSGLVQDQADLYGILGKIQNLGLQLVSVQVTSCCNELA